MRTELVRFNKLMAQGDMMIIRLPDDAPVPEGYKQVQEGQNNLVIAHSETGHNHELVLDRPDQAVLYEEDAPNKTIRDMFLTVKAEAPLEHMRNYDTHKTVAVPPGNYTIRHQREWDGTSWRRALD